MTASERAARGRAARKRVPRSSHGGFEPAPGRADPVELLELQARTRVAELVPIRHGRMLASPFAFYRGAALIMAGDLASTPTSGFTVQACGDAHLSNFGMFASPERNLVFDINDFDETLPGPWEWDLKRLCASVLIAGQDNGFASSGSDRAVLATVASYRSALTRFASQGNLAVWYAHLDVEPALERFGGRLRPRTRKRTEHEIAKAHTRDSVSAFAKIADERSGEPRIIADPPLVVPIGELAYVSRDALFARLRELLDAYCRSLPRDRRTLLTQFQLVDFARKVVGVGSVGLRAWIALLVGRDGRDPLVLQLKEAQASVLEGYVAKSRFSNHGRRVVEGQRLMQESSDIFLGWVRLGPEAQETPEERAGDFYGRQLRDWKASAQVERMRPRDLCDYGRLCGWTLARAHARTGERIAIAAYLGGGDTFDRAILAFTRDYAEQNRRDYASFRSAVESGRLPATTGL